jgi:predicted small metal-binding protein
VFRAQDEEQILVQVAEHAGEDHGLHELAPEVVGAVRENIVTMAA